MSKPDPDTITMTVRWHIDTDELAAAKERLEGLAREWKTMSRLADLLGHDGERRNLLASKLVERTVAFRVIPHPTQLCNRFGCHETAIAKVKSGEAPGRFRCKEHLLEMIRDIVETEERHHVDGVPEFLQKLLELVP